VTKQWVPVPSLPDFTDDFVGKLQGLGTIPETTPWKQGNAIKNSFSCDFNKNALELFQKQLPGSKAMRLRIRFLVTLIKTPVGTLFPSFYRCLLALQRTFVRTPQMTARQWMAHVRMEKP